MSCGVVDRRSASHSECRFRSSSGNLSNKSAGTQQGKQSQTFAMKRCPTSSSLLRASQLTGNACHVRTCKCCWCWCCCCSCSCFFRRTSENGTKKCSNQKDLVSCDHGESPPTLEEVRSWATSFDKLMKSCAGRKVFRDFLKCEYSEENILFWLACEELKRESNPDAVEEKAKYIYEDYISILSPQEVSLDSRVREIVNKNMLEPTPHTFDEAQLQIYTLMHRDSYPRFLNSPLYKKLAQLTTTGSISDEMHNGNAQTAGESRLITPPPANERSARASFDKPVVQASSDKAENAENQATDQPKQLLDILTDETKTKCDVTDATTSGDGEHASNNDESCVSAHLLIMDDDGGYSTIKKSPLGVINANQPEHGNVADQQSINQSHVDIANANAR